jgi:hypothetical protein
MRHCWTICQKAIRSLEAGQNQNRLRGEHINSRHTGPTNMHASPFDGYNKPFDAPCLFSVLNEYADDDRQRSRFYKSFAEPRGVHHGYQSRTLTLQPVPTRLRVRDSTRKWTSDTITAAMQARFGPSARLLSRESNSIYAADLLAG